MAIYQVLYWRDIPAQVRVFEGRRPISRPMPDWFQQEIDRVAMKEGLAGSDAYLDEWRWSEKMEWVNKRDADVHAENQPEKILATLLHHLETKYKKTASRHLGGATKG